MTLKAAVIYLQGSSGNLLSRALALSQLTVPYVDKVFAKCQHLLDLDQDWRLRTYNNWNSDDWQQCEKKLAMWYRLEYNDFNNYALSHLHMIAQFHPCEWITENARRVLWTDISQWQNIVIIDWQPESLEKIIELAKRKRPDLEHVAQIRNNELPVFESLKSSLANAIFIQWEQMITREGFRSIVSDLMNKLQLQDIEIHNVMTLYDAWHAATERLMQGPTNVSI